jgi:hypothetical protein
MRIVLMRIFTPLRASSPTRQGLRAPNRKGTVENAIQHTTALRLSGAHIETIEEQAPFSNIVRFKWVTQRHPIDQKQRK